MTPEQKKTRTLNPHTVAARRYARLTTQAKKLGKRIETIEADLREAKELLSAVMLDRQSALTALTEGQLFPEAKA